MEASMSSEGRADRAWFGPRTLFHLHTDWTDGHLTFDDYFAFAAAHRVGALVFLEHIRTAPTYDPADFARQVLERRDRTGIRAFVGFEAKVLAGGALDIDDRVLEGAAAIGIAEHGRELAFEQFVSSFRRILDAYPARFPQVRFVWVHPGLLLRRLGQLERHLDDYRRLLHEAVDAGVAVERNLRYDLVPPAVLAEEPEIVPVLGADAHADSDLERWLRAVDAP